MQIIAFKEKIIDPTCGCGYFLTCIFGKYRNVRPHHDIHSLFVLFPDEAVFLCIQFALDFAQRNQNIVIIFMFLTDGIQKSQHPLTLFL